MRSSRRAAAAAAGVLILAAGTVGAWRGIRARADAGAASAAERVLPTSAAAPGGADEPARSPARTPTGGVEGMVRDAAGAPVAGAQVTLTRVGGASAGSVSPVIASAASGDQGRFAFPGLAPGVYRVAATSGDRAAESGELPVAAGQGVAVDLRLGAAGLVLAGRVLDSGGGTVPRARITATQADAPGQTVPPAYSTLADEAGAYRLAVPGGGYLVTVEAAGYSPLVDMVQLSGPTTRDFRLVPGGRIAGHVVLRETGAPAAGAEVTLRAVGPALGLRAGATVRSGPDGAFWFDDVESGSYRIAARQGRLVGAAARGVDLEPAQQIPEITVLLAPAATISGRVRATGGAGGIAGATVVLLSRELRPEWRRTETGPGGAFQLPGVAAGVYALQVEAPGHVSSARELEVGAADQDVELELAAAAVLRGRVVDASGAAVEGALVTGAEAGEGGGALGPARSGPDGAFELQRASAGPAQLFARKDQLGSAGPVAVKGGDDAPVTIVLGRGAYVAGRVRFDDGRPAPGMRVEATPLQGDGGAAQAEGIAGADGSYRVGPLPAGPTTVAVDRPGQAYAAGAEPPPDRRNLTLGADAEGVDLVLPSRRQALGGVVLGPDGRPLELATVLAGIETAGEAGGGDFRTTADRDGRFTFDALPDGTYRLWAYYPGYPRAERAGVRAGARDVRLQLSPGSSVAGTAVDREGRALTDFVVSASPDFRAAAAGGEASGGGGRQSLSVHDAGGRFQVGGLAPGTFRLRIDAAGGRSGEARVTLGAGERREGARIVVAQPPAEPEGGAPGADAQTAN